MASSGNFMTFNRLAYQNSYSASYSKLDTGNLRGNASAGGWGWPSNFSFDSGKWYCEFYIYRRSGSSIGYVSVVDHYYPHIDAKYNDNRHRQPTVADYTVRYHGGGVTATTTTGIYNNQIGAVNESQTFASDQWQDGDVIAIALDLDSSPQTVKFYRNGSAKGNAENLNSSASGTWAFWCGSHNQTWITMNAGQDSSFAGNKTAQGNADGNGFGDFYYSPPSGFLAPCSANLPISADIDPAQTDDDYPSKQFGVVLYTGNGSNSARTINGFNFSPDFIWVKNRSHSNKHMLVDSSRGGDKYFFSNETTAELTSSNMITFGDSDGYVMRDDGTYLNGSSRTYVAWGWRANGGTTASNSDGNVTSTVQANTKAGFSIVTYTGTGSAGATVGHGLGAVPKWIIVRNRDSVKNWACYHVGYNSGGTRALLLNTGGTDNSNYWYGTQPTSSIFSLGGETEVNESSSNIVAYCWADVEGFQKFGSYTGNGSSDGPFVYLGFRPRLLVLKRTTSSGQFNVFDSARDTFNSVNKYLGWNVTDAEATGADVDFLSNGFKVRSSASGVNTSGTTYIYMAWGDVPAKYNNTF